MAAEWLREAMQWYERAEAMRPPGNEEAILRWNTCARLLNTRSVCTPRPTSRTNRVSNSGPDAALLQSR